MIRGISHPHYYIVTLLAMVNHYRSVVDEQSVADEEDEHEGVLLSGSDSEDDLDTHRSSTTLQSIFHVASNVDS